MKEREEKMARIEKKRDERFETFPTELPGVQLRVEPGTKLDILRKTIKGFYQITRQFAEVFFHKKDADELLDLWRKKIIVFVEEHEGLRGISSEADNFVLTVIPREKIIWDREQLKKSLGIAYSAVTREELTVNISIPVGFRTEKGVTISEEVLTKAIVHALANLGISKKDLARVMRQEVNISLDEDKVTEMINQGQIKLLEGTKASDTTWTIRVDHLKK